MDNRQKTQEDVMREFALQETEKFAHLTNREVAEVFESGEIGVELKPCEAMAIESGFKVVSSQG